MSTFYLLMRGDVVLGTAFPLDGGALEINLDACQFFAHGEEAQIEAGPLALAFQVQETTINPNPGEDK